MPDSPVSTDLPILRDVVTLRAQVETWRRAGERIALVPTMGGLHEGHLTLVRRAREVAQRVVATVFVNPTQFGPNEDFGAYPRQEARDAALLRDAQADALYAPTAAVMYPEGFSTTITVGTVSEGLCGAFRPGHFAGVATVVNKLLNQARPDVALFGEKDYQQLMVIKRMARDLDLGIEILGVPTVREADGLAMSSRNAYLSAEERAIAPAMQRALSEAAIRLAAGAEAEAECARVREAILAAGFKSVDYVELREIDTLAPLAKVTGPARLLAAARLGKARLIDNVAVG